MLSQERARLINKWQHFLCWVYVSAYFACICYCPFEHVNCNLTMKENYQKVFTILSSFMPVFGGLNTHFLFL